MGALRVIGLGLALFSCTSGATFAAPPTVCELAKKRGGLTMYAVGVNPDETGKLEVAEDLDGDGSVDKITWFQPGSGSIIPADNATLTVTLSSTGTIKVEEQRLNVVKYQANYFVVTGWLESERGPSHSEIYAISRTGFNKICSLSGKGLGP